MLVYLDDMRGSLFHGDGPTKYAQRKEKKRLAHAREQQEKALDREASDKARMRSERLRMLGELEESAGDDGERPALAFVPDGAVDARAVPLAIADGTTPEHADSTTTALSGGAGGADDGGSIEHGHFNPLALPLQGGEGDGEAGTEELVLESAI